MYFTSSAAWQWILEEKKDNIEQSKKKSARQHVRHHICML
jgi:hypothetical protein